MIRYNKGDKVICNGYPATIKEVLQGQLDGMYNVQLKSGVVCVDSSSIDPDKAQNYANKSYLKGYMKSFT